MDTVVKKIPARAWAVVFVTYLAGFTAPANMAKLAALGPVVMAYFNIEIGMMGFIMGSFNVLGAALAFPTVSLIKKFGIRLTVIIALVCAAIGSILGATTSNVYIFLVSRIFEGAGMGLMGVSGATAITPWFPKERRALPLAIWGLWVSTAMIICPTLYSFLVETIGLPFQAIWWGKMAFDIIVLLVFLIVYRDPTDPYDDADVSAIFGNSNDKYKATDIFKSKALIGLGLIFLVCDMAFMGINNFLPIYMTEVVGASLVTAGLVTTWFAITGATIAPISGKLSDYLKTRKVFILIGLCTGMLYSGIAFNATSEWIYWPLGLLGGLTGSMEPTLIWASAPETVPAKLVPNAMGWLSFTQNFGMVIGSMILGNVIETVGWTASSFGMLIPLYAIGAILLFILVWKRIR